MESTAFIPQAWVPLHAAIYFGPDQRFILSTTLAYGTLVNLEEDTDVTIENDMNDHSLQVSFDDDDVNNSSIQVSCDKEARDNSLFNISFEEVDQGTTKMIFQVDHLVHSFLESLYTCFLLASPDSCHKSTTHTFQDVSM